jgi:hypothetical protein
MKGTIQFILMSLILAHIVLGNPPKLALNVSISSSHAIGLTYHLSERFAIRPGVDFQRVVKEVVFNVYRDSTYEIEKDQITYTQYRGDLSGLRYIKSQDQLKTYLGVKLSGGRSVYEGPSFGRNRSTLDKSWLVGVGVFGGLQISINRHLSVFSEVGIRYEITTRSQSSISTNNYILSGYSSGVGILYYFK